MFPFYHNGPDCTHWRIAQVIGETIKNRGIVTSPSDPFIVNIAKEASRLAGFVIVIQAQVLAHTLGPAPEDGASTPLSLTERHDLPRTHTVTTAERGGS
jgi:hypothetical protein